MSCVLYQNTSHTVTLLDLPRSTAEWSGVALVASPGRTRPYASTEPKASKRSELLAAVPLDERGYNKKIEKLLSEAVDAVRDARGEAAWCLDRADSHLCSRDYSHAPVQGRSSDLAITTKPPLVLSASGNHFSSFESLKDTVVFNPHNTTVELYAGRRCFQIPPRSTFLLSSIERGIHNFNTSSTAASNPPGLDCPGISAGEFDFILLDPPWPNRSARHAKVYRSYSERRQEEEEHPFHTALQIVGQHLSQFGFTAIWTTNKPAIRRLVVQSMRDMGLEVFEELIWLKTTIYGEPVTPLDGLWRKPYEILLLFRRHNVPFENSTEPHLVSTDGAAYVPDTAQPQMAKEGGKLSLQQYRDVSRRVIIAVPDIHSRKPCLKEPLAPLLPDGYRALEIFARNLTAGWWSWGDEVLKFNEVPTEHVGGTLLE